MSSIIINWCPSESHWSFPRLHKQILILRSDVCLLKGTLTLSSIHKVSGAFSSTCQWFYHPSPNANYICQKIHIISPFDSDPQNSFYPSWKSLCSPHFKSENINLITSNLATFFLQKFHLPLWIWVSLFSQTALYLGLRNHCRLSRWRWPLSRQKVKVPPGPATCTDQLKVIYPFPPNGLWINLKQSLFFWVSRSTRSMS